MAWINTVDQTNGSFEDNGRCARRIDGYVELEIKKEYKCWSCGHTIGQITYKIPGKGGRKMEGA